MGSYKQQGLFCSVSENSDIKPDCVTIHAHWHELPLGIVYCGSNKLSVKIMCLRTIFIIPPKKHNFLKSCPITLVSVGPLSHSSFLPAKSLHMLSDISPISLNSPITQISQTLSIAHLLVLLKVRVFCRGGGGGGAVTNTYRVARAWLAGAAEGEAALLLGFPLPGFLN